jgi:hypothetical protein
MGFFVPLPKCSLCPEEDERSMVGGGHLGLLVNVYDLEQATQFWSLSFAFCPLGTEVFLLSVATCLGSKATLRHQASS